MLRTVILSGLVYCLSLAAVPKNIINQLQKTAISFFSGNRSSTVAHRALVGRKCDGGFCPPHIRSIIDAYRIKVGLQIISTRKNVNLKVPRIGKHGEQAASVRIKPRNGVSLFHEAAATRVKCLSAGGQPEPTSTDHFFFWQIIQDFIFQRIICQKRATHLHNLPVFRILHTSQLLTVDLNFWCQLDNYGINRRVRSGSTGSNPAANTATHRRKKLHLFTQRPASNQ